MTTVADWNPSRCQQPDVRIAVVLPIDGATTIRLGLPDAAYDVSGQSNIKRRLRNVDLKAYLSGGGVSMRIGAEELGSAHTWQIVPPQGGNAGSPPAIRVDDIMAGRGFHWQQRTTQHLPGTLTLIRHDDALVLTCRLPIEEYLVGVMTSEMSGRCPVEFLKAQCVVARSWTLAAAERKHADLDADLCNDDCCQRFQGLTRQDDSARRAARETSGQVLLTEDHRVVDANYSKSCGGIVETPENVFGTPKTGLSALVDAPAKSQAQSLLPLDASLTNYLTGRSPGLVDVYCSSTRVPETDLPGYLGRVDTGRGFFRWTVSYPREALEDVVRRNETIPDSPGRLLDIEVTRRGVSGRATELDLVFAGTDDRRTTHALHGEYAIRNALSDSFLYSSAFEVRVDRDQAGQALRFHLDGAGWGHGAGMCQIGALGMALAGHRFDAILHHYFPSARLAGVYDG
ncbi:MAG: SpoIID/LytB domain-containing protein [Phycisphaerae bacterium]